MASGWSDKLREFLVVLKVWAKVLATTFLVLSRYGLLQSNVNSFSNYLASF